MVTATGRTRRRVGVNYADTWWGPLRTYHFRSAAILWIEELGRSGMSVLLTHDGGCGSHRF
jgi:hypothetical protein